MTKKTVEERNAEFWKLSPAKRRVAIARDVIAQVRAKKYKAKRGTWFESTRVGRYWGAPVVDIQQALGEDEKPCTVCGIGGAFASMARLGNRLTSESDIYESLSMTFSGSQIGLIEHAFELGEYGDVQTVAAAKAASEFGKRYREDSERMVAIFRNVVKNEGTFKP